MKAAFCFAPRADVDHLSHILPCEMSKGCDHVIMATRSDAPMRPENQKIRVQLVGKETRKGVVVPLHGQPDERHGCLGKLTVRVRGNIGCARSSSPFLGA